jgi:hypothetical protein
VLLAIEAAARLMLLVSALQLELIARQFKNKTNKLHASLVWD